MNRKIPSKRLFGFFKGKIKCTNILINACIFFLTTVFYSGNSMRAVAADCGGVSDSCGGDTQRCYAYPLPRPGVPNIPVECTGPSDPTVYQPCQCDDGLDCDPFTYYCHACGGLGEPCCPPRPGKCDDPYKCILDPATDTYSCGNDPGGCNDYHEPCCNVMGTDLCYESSLYGEMVCDPVTRLCVATYDSGDPKCAFAASTTAYPACCNDLGEPCCAQQTGGTCFEGLDCVGITCNDGTLAPTCGATGLPCCSTPSGWECPDSGYPSDIKAGCECIGSPGEADGDSVVELLDYEGPIITSLPDLLAPIFKILFYVGIFVGFLGIIYSGYLFISSEGDPGRVKEGQEQFTAAVLGSLFVLLSVFILRVIINNILGVDSGL